VVTGTDPFTDSQGPIFDFSLTLATAAGRTLAATFNTDIDGNTRGEDGTWDRGAYEFEGANTLIGDGTDPSNSTIGPAGAATDVDQFAVDIIADGTDDTITGMTITLDCGVNDCFPSLTKVDVLNAADSSQGSETDPADDSVVLTGMSISASASVVNYDIVITPKTHANMPAVPGVAHAVTATVTAITSTETNATMDTDSATITVDNLSPNDCLILQLNPGDTVMDLDWSTPGGDFDIPVVLRSTSTISDVPVEGTTYAVDDTIGSSTVEAISGTSFTDTGLTNDTKYFYKCFSKDTRGNYAVGDEGSGTPTDSSPAPSPDNIRILTGSMGTVNIIRRRGRGRP